MVRITNSEKKRRREKQDGIEEKPSQAVAQFMQKHGFTLQVYKLWCKEHGFRASVNKTFKETLNEDLVISRKNADKVLSKHRQSNKRLDESIVSYLEGDKNIVLPPNVKTGLDLSGSYLTTSSELNVQLINLIKILVNKSDFVFETIANNVQVINALPSVVRYHANFLRSPADWKPKSHNVKKQFASLLRHLFCNYEMPAFMDKAFHDILTDHEKHRMWYIHMGLGNNIRTANDLPIHLTKKIAHYFCQAPDSYTIKEAIRYGQVLSLNGNIRTADALRGTLLTRNFNHEDFWESVIRWFIANPMLDTVEYGPIIDYLENQKYGFVRNENGAAIGGPAQPHLSMKNRDANTLLRAVHSWHRELRTTKKSVYTRWKPCGLRSLNVQEGEPGTKSWRNFTIQELIDSTALYDEGKAMSHCVGSYVQSCSTGRSSIWSLKSESIETGIQRRLTIEVNNSSKLVSQARGKFNARGTVKDANIVQRWANQNGLSVGGYVF